ncbi:MAG: hypothetical protein WC807_21215 [Hyphomicrobium sp.]|jgi:hypothetical protein
MQQLSINISPADDPLGFALWLPFPNHRERPLHGDVLLVEQQETRSVRRAEVTARDVTLVEHWSERAAGQPIAYPIDQTPPDLRITGLCLGFYGSGAQRAPGAAGAKMRAEKLASTVRSLAKTTALRDIAACLNLPIAEVRAIVAEAQAAQ